MNPAPATETVLVVAGEASADAHGAKVIEQLRRVRPGVVCFGLGGDRLQAAGLAPVADARVLSVVGITEAVRGLRKMRRVFTSVLREVDQRRPAAALLLDLPDFNLRLARKLKRRRVPVIYYIAPQAWAWRRGRVRQLRRRIRKLCVVFPFEKPFFERYGVPVEFVGHPLAEASPPRSEPTRRRVAIVPGSRPREVERLLPPLAAAARLLSEAEGELEFVLPVAAGISSEMIRSVLSREGVDMQLVPGGAGRALAGARLGLVASGTATLEAALAGVPMVVVYRVSRLTYAMVRPLVRLDHVCIVNILAGRELVPELLQGRARPGRIAREGLRLFRDGPDRESVVDGLRDVAASLGTRRPSVRVAEVMAEAMERAE